MFFEVEMQQIGAADAIKNLTGKNSRNNIYSSKQTTKMVLLNIFKEFEVRRKVRLMF